MIGRNEYELMAGQVKRGIARFSVPQGYDWHLIPGSLRWEYILLHPATIPEPISHDLATAPGVNAIASPSSHENSGGAPAE